MQREKDTGGSSGFSHLKFGHKTTGFCPENTVYPIVCFDGAKRRQNQPELPFFKCGMQGVQRKPCMA